MAADGTPPRLAKVPSATKSDVVAVVEHRVGMGLGIFPHRMMPREIPSGCRWPRTKRTRLVERGNPV
jgi:hypothetical protein